MMVVKEQKRTVMVVMLISFDNSINKTRRSIIKYKQELKE